MSVGEYAVEPSPSPGVQPGGDRYARRAQRAEAFVRNQGGAAHEDALIARVFGGAGSTALWGPILRQVLGREDGLVLRPDRY